MVKQHATTAAPDGRSAAMRAKDAALFWTWCRECYLRKGKSQIQVPPTPSQSTAAPRSALSSTASSTSNVRPKSASAHSSNFSHPSHKRRRPSESTDEFNAASTLHQHASARQLQPAVQPMYTTPSSRHRDDGTTASLPVTDDDRSIPSSHASQPSSVPAHERRHSPSTRWEIGASVSVSRGGGATTCSIHDTPLGFRAAHASSSSATALAALPLTPHVTSRPDMHQARVVDEEFKQHSLSLSHVHHSNLSINPGHDTTASRRQTSHSHSSSLSIIQHQMPSAANEYEYEYEVKEGMADDGDLKVESSAMTAKQEADRSKDRITQLDREANQLSRRCDA